jgi:hypothetical protein
VNSATSDERFRTQYLILPGIYVATIFLTAALSLGTPGGAYYRIWGICPPVASLGMVVDNDAVIVGAFLLLGTPWWYLVGRIGRDGHERRRGLLRPTVGAVIALFTCFISSAMTLDPVREDIRDNALKSAAIAQYSLVALLCVGALLGILFAVVAAVSPSRES